MSSLSIQQQTGKGEVRRDEAGKLLTKVCSSDSLRETETEQQQQFAAYRLPDAAAASPSRVPLQKQTSGYAPFQPSRPPAPGARAPVTKTVKPPLTAAAATATDDGIGKYDGGLERDQAAREAREKSGRPSARMSEEQARTLALDSSTARCVDRQLCELRKARVTNVAQRIPNENVDDQRL